MLKHLGTIAVKTLPKNSISSKSFPILNFLYTLVINIAVRLKNAAYEMSARVRMKATSYSQTCVLSQNHNLQ